MGAVVAVLTLSSYSACSAVRAEPSDTSSVIDRSIVDTVLTRFQSIERFPYARGTIDIGWPEGYEPRSSHFIICQALIDAQGRVIEVGALGCDEGKEPLCDRVIESIELVDFAPALQEGRPVPVVVVFPVTFPADRDSSVRIGPPVVDRWDDERCPYRTRIMGSGELSVSDRPAPIHRLTPEYPATARSHRVPGEVRLKAVIDTAGVPCFVLCETVDPPGAGFVECAVRAAYQWRFNPGRKGGVPQSVWVEIPFKWQPDR